MATWKFQVKLSNGGDVTIDHDDFQKLERNLADASIVFLKQRAINPSYIVEIIPVELPDTPVMEIQSGTAKQIGTKSAVFSQRNLWESASRDYQQKLEEFRALPKPIWIPKN